MIANEIFTLAKKGRKYIAKKYDTFFGLCGACGHAAGYLHYLFSKNGFRVKIAANDNHAFNIYVGDDDNYLVDVTCSQFGEEFPAVFITKLDAAVGIKYFWHIGRIFDSISEFKEWQINSGWPSDQVTKTNFDYNYKKSLAE